MFQAKANHTVGFFIFLIPIVHVIYEHALDQKTNNSRSAGCLQKYNVRAPRYGIHRNR